MSFEEELALLGVIPKPSAKPPAPEPVDRSQRGWTPRFPGEEPPF